MYTAYMRLFIVFFIFCNFLFAQESIEFYTENSAPFNFEENGELKGIAVDLLLAMSKRADIKLTKKDIKLLPWARAYTLVKLRKSCLFSTSRIPSREKLFKWVGPIIYLNHSLIAYNNGKKVEIKKFDELRKYKIGTIIDDVAETLLLEKGYPKNRLDRISGETGIQRSIMKLFYNRIDLFAYNLYTVRWYAKRMKLNPNLLYEAYLLKTGKKEALYFAFNKNVSDDTIKKLQKALDSIKKDGTYRKILDKYLK